jgi:hypothetical protein
MKNLWRDPHGDFSASKFWTTVAYSVATGIMISQADRVGWEMMLAYMAVVGGSEVAKKLITVRWGKDPDTARDTK